MDNAILDFDWLYEPTVPFSLKTIIVQIVISPVFSVIRFLNFSILIFCLSLSSLHRHFPQVLILEKNI